MRGLAPVMAAALLLSLSALAEEAVDFSGTWDTTYGTLVLFQENGSVSGYYTLGGYSTIQGGVEDDGKLVFNYTEPSASGEGWFQLSDDGNRIAGNWRPDGGGAWHEWEGYRAGIGLAPSSWLVVLESEWQSSLSEDDYSFGQMLASWFARVEGVSVRHRFIHDGDDLKQFCLESSGLPGDLFLVIASHGTPAGIDLASGTVSSRDFLQAIEPCGNLAMVHFSCCEIMAGNLPRAIIDSRESWPSGFLVSGYTNSVDWGASGVIEIFYLNQILENGLEPPEAAASVIEDIDFAASSPTRWMDAAGFTWMEAR